MNKTKLLVDMIKKCLGCKQEFLIEKFPPMGHKNGTRNYRARCYSCYNKSVKIYRDKKRPHIRKWDNDNRRSILYKISKEEILAMKTQQNNKCAICEKETQYTLNIDHDHKTGQVRGMLCKPCNTILGIYKDDINLFIRAIRYLEKFSEKALTSSENSHIIEMSEIDEK